MKKTFWLSINLFLLSLIGYAQILDEFRGIGRTGIYVNETGLLKEWPENGPEMIWSIEDIPIGHSALSSAYNMLYLTGIRDSLEYLFALSMDGKIIWQTNYGRAWNGPFPNSRCTPTIENERLYVTSGLGDLACINAMNGEIIWQFRATDKFEGTYGKWGIAESLIVLDDKLFYTPGGNKTTMVALDKMTGETIWMSESLNDNPSYTSPLLIQKNGLNIIANVTENYIIGVNADNGEMYWKFKYGEYAGKRGTNININTPIYADGKLFVTDGYDHQNVMLELSDVLKTATFLWSTDILDVHHGGTVKIGDYVYGSNWEHNGMGKWVCLEWESGKTMYETEWINKGSMIAADGLLYCYEEKFGNLAIVEPNPHEFKVISSFQIPLGSRGPYWTHPVIKDGILYVRHGDALMAYDIKKK